MVRVGKEVASVGLCGQWAKQAFSAAAELPQWERVVLTVDSGASDAVIPPTVARNLPLLQFSKVGIEYGVANGSFLLNFGEKRAEVVFIDNAADPFVMSFQVVDVHKPLLAVSKVVEAGHPVLFDKGDPHILLSTGEKLLMKCNACTYEVEIFIK